MKYAVLIYERPGSSDGLDQDELAAITGEYMALRGDPRTLDGARLSPVQSATTVRVQDAQTLVTDGPFADTKDVFAGYYVIEADDIDSAIDFAGRIPAARFGGSVELRSIVTPPV